jgi:hypothetical protein
MAKSDPSAARAAPSSSQPVVAPPPHREHHHRRSTLSAIGKFISTNSSFFSSFVIGIAGLTATSTYQCNQVKLAARQADSQMQIAREQADNNWRIERAKILSQNLQTLTARGFDTAEQRYGVLLSLSRGNILDPDVSLSYALELGRDNPEYMRSVLANIEHKDEAYYRRILTAYWVTCGQRYGVSSELVEACKPDSVLGPRSTALAQLVADDLEAMVTGDRVEGPMVLLRDEREVHENLSKLTGLFSIYLQDVFERRQWKWIWQFLEYSRGARLVGALVLSTQAYEAGTNAEHEKIKQLHATLKEYFDTFLVSPDCDHDCRARILIVILSNLAKGQNQYVHALRMLLGRPRVDVETLLARMNIRLMWCQMDSGDMLMLRDLVLAPTLLEQLKQDTPDPVLVADLLGLLALVPETGPASPAFRSLVDALSRIGDGRYARQLTDRRAAVLQSRQASAAPASPHDKGHANAAASTAPTGMGQKRHANFCQVVLHDREDLSEE